MEKLPQQYETDCLRIVLFGPESTGKSTLAAQLAKHFQTTWVPEYMRTYLEHKWKTNKTAISKKDLLPIVKGQIITENEATLAAQRYLFCDTNILQLKVYCEYYYPEGYPAFVDEMATKGCYDYYFLTDIDVPWDADILRDRPYDRTTLFRMFEATLVNNNLPYTLLSGNEETRFEKALKILNELEKN